MRLSKKKEYALLEVGGYVLVAVLLLSLSLSPLVKRSNNVLLDPLRTRDISHDAVVVAIDDISLQELGAWPLDRKVFAELIEQLNDYKIRALVFDVLFLEKKESDTHMESALSSVTYPVVLASKIVDGGIRKPVYSLSERLSTGFVNVAPDNDGKVRRFIPAFNDRDSCANPLALKATLSDTCFTQKSEGFFYPKTIPELSIVDVLRGNVPKDLLEGKTLFIGATTLDLEDYFTSLNGNKIPGVHVHVAMYASHENGLSTKPLAQGLSITLVLLFILLGYAIVLCIRKPLVQIMTLVGLLCFAAVSTAILFDLGVELPLFQILIVCFVAFVVATVFRYAHSRRENMFIKTMFSRYVNKSVLQELLKSNSYKREGERCTLSILFSDLRGFTDFSESLSPEELTRLLNEYFAAMVSEIFKENGTVDKFIGDAVMAFWNAPLPVKQHELHAVMAAIGMQEALTIFNEEHTTSLKMGIGIHSGEAVVGNIGGEERISYTALGDSINTASRIECVTKHYGARIIVSESIAKIVLNKLKQGWLLRKLDEVKLKGKQKSIILYEVTDISSDIVSAYEQALSLYQKGLLKDATQILQSELLAEDIPATILLSRIQKGLIPEGFDGVWVFDEK